MKRIAPLLIVAALATQAGCYGSYGAFNGLRRWNGVVTKNRVGQSAIHLGLCIVPVYELALIGDFFIFNTIEFATGRPVFK